MRSTRMVNEDQSIVNDTDENIPKSLFRYRSPTLNTVDEIKNEYLFFSKPSQFNDPFDCCYSIEGCDQNERRQLTENGIDDPLLVDSLLHDIRIREMTIQSMIKEKIKVCCFSERWDSLSMWTHYANSHTGVCIEYDLNSLLKNGIKPQKIHYSKEMLSRPYSMGKHPELKDVILGCFNKSEEFKSDKEWRALITKQPLEEKKSAKNCIKSITLGCRSKQYNNEQNNPPYIIEIIDICKSRNIPINIATKNFNNFKIELIHPELVEFNLRLYKGYNN